MSAGAASLAPHPILPKPLPLDYGPSPFLILLKPAAMSAGAASFAPWSRDPPRAYAAGANCATCRS